jgi:Ca-activated chloride channel family protein
MARPQVTRSQQREQATVILVLDTSGSMRARDVRPTRMDAAVAAIKIFLRDVPERFRVGLVAFSSEPQVLAPATHDRALVEDSLTFVFPGRGTAIGDAIARAVEVGKAAIPEPEDEDQSEGEAAPVAIVLLSDGAQMGGELEPLAGARRARAAEMPIFTIALGTPNGVVRFDRGPFSSTIPVPPDPATLRAVARTTGGRFFEARDAEQVSGVYRSLGSRLGRVEAKDEMTAVAIAGAAVLLLASGAVGALWSPRLP